MYETIQDFFDNHNIEPKKENSRSFIFDCPCCGGDQKLYIEKINGRSICFKHKTPECPTAKSSIAHVLSLVSGLPYDIVKKEINNEVTTNQEEKIKTETVKKEIVIEHIKPITSEQLPIDAYPISLSESQDGLDYLIGRGLDIETLQKQGILYSKYQRRVIFPAIMNNEIYGWQGRAIDKHNKLRMYNLSGEWKTKTLLFYDNLKNSNHAIIAEGAVSALKFAKVGGYVATMGKLISSTQIDLVLSSGAKKIYIALDPDAITEMEDLVKKILSQIKYSVQCFLVKVPEGKDDFGDCTYEECENAFNSAEPIDTECFTLYAYSMERT